MRTVVGLLLVLLGSGSAQAQVPTGAALQGFVLDSAGRQPLIRATLSLRSAADSSRQTLQVTDAQGHFTVRNIPTGSYFLTVSYVGYQSRSQPVTVRPGDAAINLGTIALSPRTVRLREIIVERRSPVTMRQDTIEFDAGSVTTRPNALLEDLLGQLPGVELTGEGSVRAQGQTVQRVLVNGQPFFGDDPRMALRNLPANLIDIIQIYDKRSDQSVFSGVNDGSRSRTINIVTKPEAKGGRVRSGSR